MLAGGQPLSVSLSTSPRQAFWWTIEIVFVTSSAKATVEAQLKAKENCLLKMFAAFETITYVKKNIERGD